MRDDTKPQPPSPPRRSSVFQVPVTGERSKRWMKHYRTEIAASTSSVLSTFVAYPLDSVKTRMQAYKFPTFTGCVHHTYKTEGTLGFWRGGASLVLTMAEAVRANIPAWLGVTAPLASITLVRTVSFSIYQKAKYTYSAWFERVTGTAPLVTANTPRNLPTFSTVTCFGAAGATAGGIITLIACPFELTKLSAQISVLMAKTSATSVDDPIRRSYQQLGTFKTAKNIVKHRGVMGLYSGFHLHLLRDTIGTAVYFMTYESGKQMLATYGGSSPTSPLAVVTAGGLCGIVSWACIYPIDSAKSIYQRNCLTHSKSRPIPTPKIQFFSRRMYRGLGVSMGRSCVVNAIFFSSFEFIKKRINVLELED
ncbi:MAG: hypothetical protein M1839_008785 [Geoglossum umbratile]|nr:MAG: hypothetical protein M1839_008785 [Geoglossum umbratile]